MENKLNNLGIIVTDKFIINYYGIIVIFEVAKTDTDCVYVYELKLKHKKFEGIDSLTLTRRLVPSKNTYFVPEHMNSYEKTRYKVVPEIINGKICLPFQVFCSDKIFMEAIKKGTEYPVFGTVYAEPLKDYLGVCWENEDKRFIFEA